MVRNIRLISGWILFIYLFTHLTNLMLGIWSVDMMDQARPWFQAPWDHLIGRIILSLAFLTHGILAFQHLFQHRNYAKMTVKEWLQIIFGLLIPPLLILHYLGTLIIAQFYGSDPNFAWMLLIYWKGDVNTGIRQVVVLIIAWTHGCLGLYFWYRLKPYWAKIRGYLLGIALVWPILALLGVLDASREVVTNFNNQDWLKHLLTTTNQPTPDEYEYLLSLERNFLIGYMLVILAVLLLRYFRPHWEARKGRVIIRYDTGRKIETITGRSILDISLNHQHPHANVCGGKGRCSTCRIRIMGDISKLPPPSPEESKILKRIKASHDIRLACQCMPPPGEYLVSCLMPVETKIQDVHARKVNERGKESEIIILFADLRGFTKLSEEKLPYDVVFILNRFFAMMGEAVEKNNGHLDKFLGDGVMAIFGLERSPSLAARDAIQSAKDMIDGIETLNHTLAAELPHPLKIGIGIHAGPAIIGDMGYGKATHFTAIGDTVNTASRLESLTKDLEAAILISERVIHHSSIDVVHLESIETPLRGKKQTLRVYPIKDSRNITL